MQSEEKMLVDKMKIFKRRTQAQWGVPLDLVSPLGWQSAVFELAGVELNLTPSTQLHILTRTIKAIYSEFKLVVLPRLQTKGKYEVYISADDLVPIFIFIFCQSELRHPIKNRELMWSLCHPDLLQGEAGYYLTIYESSIEFILSESITSASFASPSSRNSIAVSGTSIASPLSSPSTSVIDISSLKTKDRESIISSNKTSNSSSRRESNNEDNNSHISKTFQRIIVDKFRGKTLSPSAMSKQQNASMRESFNSELSS